MSPLFRAKAVNADRHPTDTRLRRLLGPIGLVRLGRGVGIFVLTDIAATAKTEPAIMLPHLSAGLAVHARRSRHHSTLAAAR